MKIYTIYTKCPYCGTANSHHWTNEVSHSGRQKNILVPCHNYDDEDSKDDSVNQGCGKEYVLGIKVTVECTTRKVED